MRIRFQADADLNQIIVSQKIPVAQVAEELFLIWYASESEEWVNRIRSLPL